MPDAGETTKTEFNGSQGTKLAAALELPSGPPRAFALFAHCFSCSKDIKAAREMARALRTRGFAVLRFDFTGLGSSEGDFANTNFTSNVEDLVKAANFLRDEFEAPGILIGHSLGGAAALVAAQEIPELKGVCVIAAPAEAGHVVQHIGDKRAEIERAGEAVVDLAGRPFKIKKQFLDDLENQSVLGAAEKLKKPLLVMHGPLDQTVGVDNATRIFIAAKHPKSFVSLDTADHLLSKTDDARYAAGVVAAWADRYIDAPAPETEPEATAAISNWKPVNMVGEFEEGAAAESVDDHALTVHLSVDGHPVTIDASKEDGGDDLGPNPTRTVEGALAACAVMTMKMYAARKKWPLDHARVEVRRAESADAHVSRELVKTVSLTGDLDEAQRERLLEIADKCPVHRMLSGGVMISSALALENA